MPQCRHCYLIDFPSVGGFPGLFFGGSDAGIGIQLFTMPSTTVAERRSRRVVTKKGEKRATRRLGVDAGRQARRPPNLELHKCEL